MLVYASQTSNRKLRDIAAQLVLTGELAGPRLQSEPRPSQTLTVHGREPYCGPPSPLCIQRNGPDSRGWTLAAGSILIDEKRLGPRRVEAVAARRKAVQ
jgi:hypothetical protein